MKTHSNPEDAKLSSLLRESRVSPGLPPRFQQNVWRRIEDAAASAKTNSWLEAVVTLIFRPRFAFATAAVLLLAGGLLGTHEGSLAVRHEAQARYVAYVAPNPLR